MCAYIYIYIYAYRCVYIVLYITIYKYIYIYIDTHAHTGMQHQVSPAAAGEFEGGLPNLAGLQGHMSSKS